MCAFQLTAMDIGGDFSSGLGNSDALPWSATTQGKSKITHVNFELVWYMCGFVPNRQNSVV